MGLKGDFLGFTFQGVHSSELGITRVYDGDRYKDTLFPEIKDLNGEVSNRDGEYYFGSNYGVRHFNINIAYDSMTESQLRQIKQLFGRQQIGALIFDEMPYKKYLVKLEDPIELSYVCFGEALYEEERLEGGGIKGRDLIYRGERKLNSLGAPATERIYKGEGAIDMIAYYPFAKSCFKVLPTTGYDNVDEWAKASKILDSSIYNNYDSGHGFDFVFKNGDDYKVNIYNAGDIETSCRIYCPFIEDNESYSYGHIEFNYISNMSNDIHSLILENVVKSTKNNSDIGFLINTDNGLIQGVQAIDYEINGNPIITTSNSLYNQYVKAGEFFKLQPNLTYTDNSSIIISGGNEAIKIFYDYLYF